MTYKYCSGPEWQAYEELAYQRPKMFAESDQIRIVLNRSIVNDFVEKTRIKVGVLYSSPYHYLVVDLIQEKDGTYYTYERILPAIETGAVVALTIYNEKFVLLKQFRHAIRESQFCFPRGFGEPDLSAEENVKKELQEELGASIRRYAYLGDVAADSGLVGNLTSVFVCEIETFEKRCFYEGIEDVTMLTADEMKNWIAEGKITDGFTLSAYSLYLCKTMNENTLHWHRISS